MHDYLVNEFKPSMSKQQKIHVEIQVGGFDHLSSIDSGDNNDDVDEGEVLEVLEQ